MQVICNECQQRFDDLLHQNLCPHEALPVLDDIWGDESGVHLRVVRSTAHTVRLDVTETTQQEPLASVTLQTWRAQRLSAVLANAFTGEESKP